MSTKGKEYQLAVRIAGVIDKSFDKSLSKTHSSLSKNFAKLNTSFNTLDKGYDNIMKVGVKAFKMVSTTAIAATTAVAAVAVAVSKVGIEFESAFAGVRKTVDATEEEFALLRQNILDMSKTIPSAATEIAGVMEVAGQLGIATENLTDFTKVMINLGVSTNMSAEEAATALAKFANITNMDPKYYDALGSTIVDLGNNFATTELDIVQMATRLAATGELAGLTEAQIMAIATAMSSVGIESESGGSTMSKLLKKMQVAVETNSDSLKEYASIANMTGEEFAAVFREDAVEALSAFVDGLNDTERNGRSAIVVLNDMGLNEVRLSNTILSLANASGLMSEAITTANEAWEESSALTVEAEKRYATTESKLSMLKNSFIALGIEAFDEIEGPFKEGIDWLTDSVIEFTEFATGPNGMSKWANNLKTTLPSVAKNAKTFGKTVLNFTAPLLSAGKWLIKHPKFLANVFVATGTALATYKVASSITHIINGVTTLISSPVMLGIAGVTALIGAGAAAVYAYNKSWKDFVNLQIEENFGDIALSMEEIQQVADHIIDSGSLEELTTALTELNELEDIQSNINNAVSALRKMNWKVGIGMELEAEEQEQYKTEIQSFVESCQDYVLQQQYAVTLSIQTLLTDEELKETNIVDTLNGFYANKYNELSKLGTDLSNAVTEAFSDNFLNIEEAKEIAELQQQMANIQNALAGAEFDAALTSLGFEYSGKDLDADTFKSLQAELATRVEEAQKGYKEAYAAALVNAELMKQEGAFTSEAEYESYIDSIYQGYLNNVSAISAKASKFLTGTLLETEGIEKAVLELWPRLSDYRNGEGLTYNLEDSLLYMIDEMEFLAAFKFEELLAYLNDDKYGLLAMMEETKTSLEALEAQYTQQGLEIPTWLAEALTDYTILEEYADPNEAAANIIAAWLGSNEEWSALLAQLRLDGAEISESLAEAIDEGSYGVVQSISDMYSAAQKEIASHNISMPNMLEFRRYQLTGEVGSPLGLIGNLPGHADGGIFTQPHIAAFAEKGMEAAIPIDGSQNAISLWEKTGRLLGMESSFDDISIGSREAHIEYKPTLVFQGGAPTQSDLENAMRTSQDEFEAMMNRYIKEHGRFAF